MTIYKQELKSGRKAFIIWAAAISFLLVTCVLIYPEMKGEMGEISKTFAEMGSFSQAFGLDQLNFGEFSGFFGVECGNILGLGGAFFAAMTAVSALAKEEKEHTAEFLLSHPLSRGKIVSQKLLSVLTEIVLLNVVVVGITVLSIAFINEKPDAGTMALLFLSYFLMQLEIVGICFGISAFISRGDLGIGLGIAAVFYFLNIISNLTEEAKALKYITPFGYTDSANILADKALNGGYLAFGMVLGVIGISAAYLKYTRKDIR